jgi:uncharacterized protein (TIGR02231 family)
MRLLLSAFALIPSLAWAEIIPVESRVSDVTLHPYSAAITRTSSLDIPAGAHRLVLLGVPRGIVPESLRVNLSGAERTGLIYRDTFVPPRDYKSDAVLAAENKLQAINARIQNVHNAAAKARLAADAAKSTIRFLDKLGENEGLAQADPESLRTLAQLVGQEALGAAQIAHTAELEARNIEQGLKPLQQERQEAQEALQAIALEDENRLYIAIEATAATAGTATVTLSYIIEGASNWAPAYDLNLETSGTPALTIQRDAMIEQSTGENWTDVTLHLSTVEPVGQIAPSEIHTNRLRISEPAPQPVPLPRQKQRAEAYLSDAPLAETVVADSVGQTWQVATSAVGVTYTYGRPVSVASNADILRLELDNLSEPAEVMAWAAPLRDNTAFRVARITNTSGEEILASPFTSRYVNGELIGSDAFDGLVVGERADIAFGPIDGLQLSRDILARNEGDTGIISRSNQKTETVEIKIDNLTKQDWPLRLLDRIPYSEQEDLQISWTARPMPSDQNVDKRRGILAWDLKLKPGEVRTIHLETTLNWPEGMVLR